MAKATVDYQEVGDSLSPFYDVKFYAANFIAERSDSRLSTGPNEPDFANIDDAVFDDDVIGELILQNERQDLISQENLNFYVNNLEVEFMGSSIAHITITMTPPYHDAIRIIDSRLIQRTGIITVEWGYSGRGNNSEKSSGVYMFSAQKPSISFSGSDITITVKGTDLLYVGASSKDERRTFDRKIYSSDLSIIKKLASELGLVVDDSELPTQNPLRDIRTFPESITINNNNWTFIRSLLFENRCVFNMSGKTLVIKSRDAVIEQDCAYKFIWYKQMQNKFEIPMLTFDTDVLDQLFSALPPINSVTSVSADPDTGSVVKTKYDSAADPTVPKTGKYTGAGEDNQKRQVVNTAAGQVIVGGGSGEQIITSKQRNNSEERVRVIADDWSIYGNEVANITAIGVPSLVPNIMVKVEGVGNSFGGYYMVNNVKHTIGTDGYTMAVKLIRNSSSLIKGPGNTIAAGRKKVSAEQNSETKKPETDPDKHPSGR